MSSVSSAAAWSLLGVPIEIAGVFPRMMLMAAGPTVNMLFGALYYVGVWFLFNYMKGPAIASAVLAGIPIWNGILAVLFIGGIAGMVSKFKRN